MLTPEQMDSLEAPILMLGEIEAFLTFKGLGEDVTLSPEDRMGIKRDINIVLKKYKERQGFIMSGACSGK